MITIRKTFASLCIASLPFTVPVSSYAELVAYEGFDYGLGTSRLHQVDGGPVGGFGWADKWTNFVEGDFLSNRIFGRSGGVGTSLDPGFPFETTGAYLRSDFGGDHVRWIQTYRQLAEPIDFGGDGTHYVSVLLSGNSHAESDALVYLATSTGMGFWNEDSVVRFGLGSAHSSGGSIGRFNLRVEGGETIISDSSDQWNEGQVYLAVLKIETSSTSDDVVSVSFFSADNPLPEDEPTDWLMATTLNSDTRADWVRLSARGEEGKDFYSEFDEVRIGTSWDSVTPTEVSDVSPTEVIYVSPTGSDSNDGGEDNPFRTISRAAEAAQPGTVVFVKEGVYRERVAPPRGGTEGSPIVYQAEPGKNVFIKGSDIWEPEWTVDPNNSDIFYATLDPGLFTDDYYWDHANPFKVPFTATPFDREGFSEYYYGRNPSANPNLILNLGQIFVNGERYQQRPFVDEVSQGTKRWTYDRATNRIYIRFPDLDPEAHTVEITTRRAVFAPHRTGLGHIHLEGFIIEHAANQYPRDFWMRQEASALGAVDTRFGHNWLIRDNIIRYASGMGIQAGLFSLDPQINSLDEGAGRQTPSGHPGGIVIRDNHIVDNGGGGIIASGAREMSVEGNVILRNNAFNFIGDKRWESAGFKAHFFYDSQVVDNYFGWNKAAGIWLDNRWVGVDVSHNVIVGNDFTNEAGRSLPPRRRGFFLEKANNDWDTIELSDNILLQNRIYGHNASGASFFHNLVANTPTDIPAVELRHLNDPDSRSDKHTLRHNILLSSERLIQIPYPQEFGGPVRLDQNVYDAGFDSRKFAPSRYFRLSRPGSGTFYNNFLDPDLGDDSPGVSTLSANDGYLTLSEWIAFWDHHDIEVDSQSLLSTGNTVTYDETTHQLTFNVAFDPAAMAVIPGPFPNLVQGENQFTIWNGLPLLGESEVRNEPGEPVVHRPLAYDQSVTTIQGKAVDIRLRGQSENRHPLTFSIVDEPQHGTLSGAIPDLVYQPESSFSGEETFRYRVSDGTMESDVAVVTIQVEQGRTSYFDGFEAEEEETGRWWFSTWAGVTDEEAYNGMASIEVTRFGRAMRSYNFLGMKNRPTLNFAWKLRNPAEFEQSFVKVFDGDWHTVMVIDSVTEPDVWVHEEIDLSGFNMTSDFRILFEGFGSSERYEWFIDEVSIESDPLLAYESFSYGPNGTRLHEVSGGPFGGFGWEWKWTNFVEGDFLSSRIRTGSLDPGFPFERQGNRLESDWGGDDAQWLQTFRQLERPVDLGGIGSHYLSILLRGSSLADSDALVHLQDTTDLSFGAGEIRFGLGSAASFGGSSRFTVRAEGGELKLSEESWEPNVVYLAVLKVTATPKDEDTVAVSFFSTDNPLPRREPETWMLTTTVDSDAILDWVRLNGRGEEGNAYWSDFDELRVGLTWDAVTPRPSVPELTYDLWRDQQGFESVEAGEASVDPTGDGVSNLMAYALGLDPLEMNRGALPQPGVEEVDGKNYLSLTVFRNPQAADIEYSIEVSSDLENWEEDSSQTSVILDTDEMLKVRDNTSISETERRFMRLRVRFREKDE